MDATDSMPRIPGLRDKIATLERRLAHLDKRVNDPGRRGASRDFDRAEASAVRAGIECMRYVGDHRDGGA